MKTRAAFSLVELSIVLVILGLLTGGIMAGQSLIRGAELRSTISDQGKYRSSLLAFRDKYGQLPGDFDSAVKYWGAQAGGTADGVDATCQALTTAATGTATCNGNGDGQINASTAEMWRAWQHMANAGFIEGQYSGVSSAANAAVIGSNVPRGRMGGSGWTWQGGDWNGGDNCDFPQSDNRLAFGGQVTGNITMGAILKPEEAWSIDSKTDDGMPGTGGTLSWAPGCLPNCTTGLTTAAAYNVSYTGAACALIFLPGSRS